MSAGQGVEVAAELEAAIRATPGVSDLYRSGSSIADVVVRGARHLGLRDDDAPLVVVQRTGAGIRVNVDMGVHTAASAAATTLAVHRTVRDLLTQREMPDAHVVLTVVHVDDTPPAVEAGRT